jgi:hypothetical protein
LTLWCARTELKKRRRKYTRFCRNIIGFHKKFNFASIHEALQSDIQLSAVSSSIPYSFTKSLADHPGHDSTGASKLQELNRNNIQ